MKSWLSREDGGTWSFRGPETRSEAGDSLIEVLIALTVISLTAVALLLAFGTSIAGSGEDSHIATFDTALRTASAEVTSFIQQQPSSNFANCSGASQYSTPGSISLPSGYSARVTAVAYWNGSGFTSAQPPGASCPSSPRTGASQPPIYGRSTDRNHEPTAPRLDARFIRTLERHAHCGGIILVYPASDRRE